MIWRPTTFVRARVQAAARHKQATSPAHWWPVAGSLERKDGFEALLADYERTEMW